MTSKDTPTPADDFALFAHRARYALIPMAVIAAGLTVEVRHGAAFFLGAIVAWLLFLFLAMCEDAHRWDVCSYCDGPPPRFSTPQNRLKTARRIHGLGLTRRVPQLLVFTVAISIFAPKPYLHHWWGQVGAAALYAGTALDFVIFATVTTHHQELYRAECPNEKCRAGDDSVPRIRSRMWLGHYGPWILPVLAPGACATGILGLHWGDPYETIYLFAQLLLALTAMGMLMDHLDNPCIRCADVPSNGGELAEKRMPWLRAHHQYRHWLPGAAAFFWAISWGLPHTVAGRVMLTFAALWLLPWAVLIRIHGKVQPWCPWCREGDGDSESEDVPDPTVNHPAPV